MIRPILTLLLTLSLSTVANAQIGGSHVYEFLNLPQSARATALGSHLYALADSDVNTAYSNPATLNPYMSKALSFNYNFNIANIGNGHLAYGQYWKKHQITWHTNLQYMTYGTLSLTDEFGNVNGTFKAADYALTLGAGKQIYDKVSVGANLRFVSSQLETYKSSGLATDLGALYQDTTSNFTAALVFRNIGTQLTSYREGNIEKLPYNVHFSVSKKLKHLPFRFALTYSYLNRWNVTYDDPNAEDQVLFINETAPQENKFGTWVNNFSRHLSVNGELLLGKHEGLKLRFGYNHLRKKELSVNTLRSLAGWSLGFGMKVKRFRIDYGHAFYHIGGSTNHFTLSTNIQEFSKKVIK